MSATEERINNAIVALQRAAWRANRDGQLATSRVAAIDELVTHWAKFWRSRKRAWLPTSDLAQPSGPLQRYVSWYTRGWALLPESYRASIPRPDAIEPKFAQAARDTIKGYMDGVDTVAQSGDDIARWADARARELAKEIRSSASLGWLGIAIGAGLTWYLFIRGSK